MRFDDIIDSNFMQFNSPLSRVFIRKANTKKYMQFKYDFDIVEFCKKNLKNFFPKMVGIWADYHHFTHERTLKLV